MKLMKKHYTERISDTDQTQKYFDIKRARLSQSAVEIQIVNNVWGGGENGGRPSAQDRDLPQ